MKKVLFPILALVLALGLAVPAAAHTEGSPFVTDLIADGGSVATEIDVGDVSVWNDGTNLNVTYQTTAGWEMTETHLAIATSLAGIPQNRAGNPKVGKFPYSTAHTPPVTTYTYTISLGGWSSNLVIAAHADVQKLDVITASFATGDGIDTVEVIAEGNPNYPVGYPGPYGGPSGPAVLTWIHPSWPSIAGAQWISSAPYVENPPPNSWRLFTWNFDVPSNAVNLSGTLQITSDNAEEVELNGTPVGIDGEVYGPFTDNHEWSTILSHAVSPQPGPNTLEVMVRNYAGSSSPTDNPTGLIYKMDYEYQLLRTETAWGDGFDFPGKNWATYFGYHVQGILTGTWLLDVNDGSYMHDMFIVSQDSTGALTGTGGYPETGPPYLPGYDWTLTGQLTGNSVTLVITYTNGYTATISGNVDSGWDSMSGGAGTGGVLNWVATRL